MKFWKALGLWFASDIGRVRELQRANANLKQQLAAREKDVETLEAWVALIKKEPTEGPNTMPMEYVTRVLAQAKRFTLNGISLYDQPKEVLLAILMNEVDAQFEGGTGTRIPMYQLALAPGDTFRFNNLTFECR